MRCDDSGAGLATPFRSKRKLSRGTVARNTLEMMGLSALFRGDVQVPLPPALLSANFVAFRNQFVACIQFCNVMKSSHFTLLFAP